MYIWIIFGVLVFALIIFFAYSALKDRRNKKKLKEERALFETETVDYHAEMLVTINEIIEENKKYLDNFQVSVGEYKMGEITDTTRKIIDEIVNSRKFKGFFIGNDKYVDLVKNIVKLKDLKSNNWQKKALPTIEYFEKEYDKIASDKIENIKPMVGEEINKKYHEALLKKS